jgi:hypothetical protein
MTTYDLALQTALAMIHDGRREIAPKKGSARGC